MSRLGWPAHVHAHKMNKIMKKIILHVHLRSWSSSTVKRRGISCNIGPLSEQYEKLWTALGEQGLVSGMNTLTWHAKMGGIARVPGQYHIHTCPHNCAVTARIKYGVARVRGQ